MASPTEDNSAGIRAAVSDRVAKLLGWRLPRSRKNDKATGSESSDTVDEKRPSKWSLGVLNDKETEEVPGKPN